MVSDAGTPGISDPGQYLISKIRHACHSDRPEGAEESLKRSLDSARRAPFGARDDNSIKIIPIPGPSALTAAASVSGMIDKEFYFAGFLPKKKGRQTEFKRLLALSEVEGLNPPAGRAGCPIVIYESAIRLPRTLNDILEYFGENTEVFIAREISKVFEENWSGSIGEVIADLDAHKIRGELVLIVRTTKSPRK